MGFFKQVEGEAAIVVINGVYKQCDLYERDGYIYAKTAGGFVRLMADGSTTRAKMRLDFMTWTGSLCRDSIGRLCSPDVAGSRTLESNKAQLLLGSPEQ
jgi:hypothetical protein